MDKSSPELRAYSQELAKTHYYNLDYHNWNHVTSMREYASKRIPNLSRLGVTLDADVVDDAILWHDADFQLDPQKNGFVSKEALAAATARTNLLEMGHDEDYVEKVEIAIIATQLGQPRPTNEATLVVESDLHNVAGPRKSFLLNSVLLANEQLRLGNSVPASAKTFMEGSAKFLGNYFADPFSYIADDGSIIEQGSFTNKAMKNIRCIGRSGLNELQKIPECINKIPDQWKY